MNNRVLSDIVARQRRIPPPQRPAPPAPVTPTAPAKTTAAVVEYIGFLDAPVDQGTLVQDGNWYSLDLSSDLPSGVSCAILDGYVRVDSPDNADQELLFRKEAGAAELYATKNRGVSTVYAGGQAFQIIVPVTSSRTLEYRVSDSLTAHEVRLIGWVK